MTDRKELADRLSEIKKEFEGFPEEQTISEVIDELSTNDSHVTIPSPEVSVRVTDILLMARTLGAYCYGRPCSECVFNEDIGCAISGRWRDIDIKMLKKHEGEEVTFYREDE